MNPVFHCADLAGDQVELTGPEGRHASTVRRIRVGERVDLVDGAGTRCTCDVVAVGKDVLTCAVLDRVLEPAPTPRITLVQALAKGSRGELAVELATEVGVDVVVPWSAARSIAKAPPGEPPARWVSTAREAAKQSRRAWFPEVTAPRTTSAVAGLPGQLLVLHESADAPLSAAEITGDVVLVVGPEGGIAPEELDTLSSHGGSVVRLGRSVLRTSTAGAAAIAVVSSRTGRW